MPNLTHTPVTYPSIGPETVYAVLRNQGVQDPKRACLTALVKAERDGLSRVGTITITHAGYLPGVSEFNASTATYRVTTS